ncbi:unnamed protein product [Prunus armeniaca]
MGGLEGWQDQALCVLGSKQGHGGAGPRAGARGNWAIARHGLALGKLATCSNLGRSGASPGPRMRSRPRWALELGWRLALGWRHDY